MNKEIIILAGGKGSRLGDLTKDCQKCMLPINGKPFLDLLIKHYRKQGFNKFIISTGYLAEQVESYNFGTSVSFVRNTEIKQGWNIIRANLWVVNGDTWIP